MSSPSIDNLKMVGIKHQYRQRSYTAMMRIYATTSRLSNQTNVILINFEMRKYIRTGLHPFQSSIIVIQEICA